MSLIGHNGGPSVAGGTAWRTHCWRQARDALLPTLPIEVVRLRVRRAKELGLDYKTYAGVRATTGHDVVAFLFSTNALNLLRAADRVDPARLARLAALKDAGRLIAVHAPLDPQKVGAMLANGNAPAEALARAPSLADNWRATRAAIRSLLAQTVRQPDRVLLIGDTMLEREWVSVAHLAGYLPTERYFAVSAQHL